MENEEGTMLHFESWFSDFLKYSNTLSVCSAFQCTILLDLNYLIRAMHSPVGQVKKVVLTPGPSHFKPGLPGLLPQHPATSLTDVKVDPVGLEFLAVI